MNVLKIFTITMLGLFLALALKASEPDTTTYWKYGGLFSLNFSQASFSKNWQAGGESSMAGLGILSTNAIYAKEKSEWESALNMKYGTTKQQGNAPRKTDDVLEVMSKYGYKAAYMFFYTASINFNTQMAPGYTEAERDTPISNFLAPAYLLVSLGMDFKPNEDFSLILAPLTGKLTIVNDDYLSSTGRFGVEPGKKIRSEFGAYLKSQWIQPVMKNVTFQSKVGLFFNYLEDPQVDVDWEAMVNLKVNEFLAVNIISQLIYDKDQVDEVQFKEVLGLGFAYKF